MQNATDPARVGEATRRVAAACTSMPSPASLRSMGGDGVMLSAMVSTSWVGAGTSSRSVLIRFCIRSMA